MLQKDDEDTDDGGMGSIARARAHKVKDILKGQTGSGCSILEHGLYLFKSLTSLSYELIQY